VTEAPAPARPPPKQVIERKAPDAVKPSEKAMPLPKTKDKTKPEPKPAVPVRPTEPPSTGPAWSSRPRDPHRRIDRNLDVRRVPLLVRYGFSVRLHVEQLQSLVGANWFKPNAGEGVSCVIYFKDPEVGQVTDVRSRPHRSSGSTIARATARI